MISLLVVLIVCGVLLWAVGQLPIDGAILQIIRAVVVVCAVIWLLEVVGLMPRAWPRGFR